MEEVPVEQYSCIHKQRSVKCEGKVMRKGISKQGPSQVMDSFIGKREGCTKENGFSIVTLKKVVRLERPVNLKRRVVPDGGFIYRGNVTGI